jgi:recombination associated protein RdgC
MAFKWFHHAFLYRVDLPQNWDAAELESRLQAMRLNTCGKTQSFTAGWSSPFGPGHEVLSHACYNRILMCYTREERVLPNSVIQEAIDARIKVIEARDDRQVFAKERRRLKDEVTFDLLPQAFTARRGHAFYLDVDGGFLLLDVASKSRADDISHLLVESVPGLKLHLLDTSVHVAERMSQWLLQNSVPSDFALGSDCVMQSMDQESNTVRFSGQDLGANSVLNHLKNGKQVKRLQLIWKDKLAFMLHANLQISAIKPTDIIKEQQSEWEHADAAQKVDADFALMSMEFSSFIKDLAKIVDVSLEAKEPAEALSC